MRPVDESGRINRSLTSGFAFPMPTCTVIARNYVGHARVLAQCFAAHHHGERVSVLVLDDAERTIRAENEPFDVLRPEDLALDADEFLRMAGIYEVTELATAVKPWLLAALLARGADAVTYLDPDMVVLGSLSALTDAADASPDGIALTPHRLTPVPDDGRRPTANELLRSGTFNLGFIAVTAAAAPFLAWWQAHLRRDCLIEPDHGLFVDQRWVDGIPALWQPTVARDTAYNVAYWNADERPTTDVRLLHFSGFDPDVAHLLSRNTADAPRVLLSAHPDLAAHAARYADALAAAGEEQARKNEFGFACSANGYVLDRRSRRCYRAALVAAERDGTDPPPCPFRAGDEFVAWLRSPAPGHAPRVSRYLEALWAGRADLRAAFPTLEQPDGFLAWVQQYGQAEERVPAEMLPAGATDAAPPASLAGVRAERGLPPQRERGVNVVGYFAAESGVGEGARLLVSALRAGGVPHSLVGHTDTIDRQHDPFGAHESRAASHDVNIVCINADQIPRYVDGPGRALFDGRPTVGLWMWEVDVFPPAMAAAARYVDEIWMGSEYAAAAVRRAVDVPVFSFPLPVTPLDAPTLTRAGLGLPDDQFVFLFAFSFLSVLKRKNPFMVVDAFMQAFEPNEGPRLVIKSIHGDRDLRELERLRALAATRRDIEIRDGVVDRAEHASLVHACDAYVSLHRAEGFGLTTAEAMAIGKPVIATGYSGNLENMTPDNSWLVPYELVPVGEGAPPYPPDATWAEPDVDAAAAAMREVVYNPHEAARRGARAARDIAAHHGPAARVAFIHERLAALQADAAARRRAFTPPVPATFGGQLRLGANRLVYRLPEPLQAALRRLAARAR